MAASISWGHELAPGGGLFEKGRLEAFSILDSFFPAAWLNNYVGPGLWGQAGWLSAHYATLRRLFSGDTLGLVV